MTALLTSLSLEHFKCPPLSNQPTPICTSKRIKIANVYVVPGISVTLLSVSQLVYAGYIVHFVSNVWMVTRGKAKRLVRQALENKGVYQVRASRTNDLSVSVSESGYLTTPVSSLTVWHRQLGHLLKAREV
ncbi:Retroelement pol Polyprotein [Phytophthora megakarya]|uniref:Retroelement pol Polyprotein n=1 Tax=Phytophthora megakarya TaxID=4795 RepID=A0A225WJA9_9STRA|nr:Retroelement pol Polyprotein [Phytophthora megakarya]